MRRPILIEGTNLDVGSMETVDDFFSAIIVLDNLSKGFKPESNIVNRDSNYTREDVVIEKVKKFKTSRGDRQLMDTRWHSLRKDALSLMGNTCMCCGEIPDKPVDLHVDHIKPRSKYPELMFDINNLQILYRWCNFKKGIKETDYRPKILTTLHEK